MNSRALGRASNRGSASLFRWRNATWSKNKALGLHMLKRLAAGIGAIVILAALTLPSLAVEGAAERQERKKREAQKFPQQASEAYQKGNDDLAIELFTKAIDSRAFKDQPETLGEIYFGRGSAYRRKGDCNSAIPDFEKAAELNPEGDTYYSLAACQIALNQEDQALASLDKAIKIDPEAASYRSARCIMLFNRKDFAGALPDCEKAAAAAPKDKNVLTAAAQAAEQTGNKARAAELYRQLLAADPGNPIATEGLKRVS